MTTDDMTLVREYAAHQTESAFATLVSRHTDLVYSTALRRVRDPQLAMEVTQAVFILLARKAGSFNERTILPGWLYRTACFASGSALKQENRRQQREQEAYMQSTLNEAGTDAPWKQMSPLLEEAMLRLGQTDRDALVLRFFEERSLNEVGAALGASEDAAKKRVNRALEKLRKIFVKRGVALSAAVIAGALAANSVQAAPAGLVISTVSIVKGSTATASILTLVKGTMNIMTWIKLKTAAAIGVAVILATGTTIVASKVFAQSSNGSFAIDDSAWVQIDTRSLKALPPAFILRPTHFENSGGGMVQAGNNMLGRSVSFDMLMSIAYDVDLIRVVSPPDKPAGGYDLLMTTLDASREKLQKEIQRQFGYVARRETRQSDILLLTVKQTGAPGLKPSQGQTQNRGRGFASSSSSSAGAGANVRTRSVTSQNQPIPVFIRNLQGYFDKPIIDQTSLAGNFDVSFSVTTRDGGSESEAIMQALPGQLGLELVPRSESIEMLVVEKAKN